MCLCARTVHVVYGCLYGQRRVSQQQSPVESGEIFSFFLFSAFVKDSPPTCRAHTHTHTHTQELQQKQKPH